MRIAAIKDISLVDGPGTRLVIFFAGCAHDCPGCHNTDFQEFNSGIEYEPAELVGKILSMKGWLDGVTISGGDPLYQQAELITFLKMLNKTCSDINIMLYTGFSFNDVNKEVKEYVNVIVDGEYDENLPSVRWRGSSNQRLYLKKGNDWLIVPDLNKEDLEEEKMVKHMNDGITYSEIGGIFKCKNCGKRYSDKDEECTED